MSKEYLVTWEIDADEVDTPREAAEFARWAQTNPGTIATVFQVRDKETGETFRVDLSEEEG